MSQPVLSVKNLSKSFLAKKRLFFFKSPYIPIKAVDRISFALKEGEVLGILGSNGAGKTTLIEMLLGILTPSSGEISYFGKNFFKESSAILQHITHASAYNKMATYLTIQENLEIIGLLYGLSLATVRKRISRLLEYFSMEEFRDKPAGTLSAGQLTRVMLVKAFLPHPRIVLLDEPTASLDPDMALDVRAFIKEQQKAFKVSLILTSHNMQEVGEVCDRVLVLQKGKIIQEDTPEKLAKSVALTEVRLKNVSGIEPLLPLFKQKEWEFRFQDNKMAIDLDESEVPELLKELHQQNVRFTHIEIEKPTLEDYFLYISRPEEYEEQV